MVGDHRASRVVASMGPFLRADKLGDAVCAGLDTVVRYQQQGPPGWREWASDAAPTIAFLAVCGAFVAFAIHTARTERRHHRESDNHQRPHKKGGSQQQAFLNGRQH